MCGKAGRPADAGAFPRADDFRSYAGERLKLCSVFPTSVSLLFPWASGYTSRSPSFGFPRWVSGKESTCQCRKCGFDPWVEKIPWRRSWQPTPVFLPGESPWTEEPGGVQSWAHTDSDTTATKTTTTPSFPYRQSLIKPNWRGREEKLTDGEFCGIFHIQTRRWRQSLHQKQ